WRAGPSFHDGRPAWRESACRPEHAAISSAMAATPARATHRRATIAGFILIIALLVVPAGLPARPDAPDSGLRAGRERLRSGVRAARRAAIGAKRWPASRARPSCCRVR